MKFVLTHPLNPAAMALLEEKGADVFVANSEDPETFMDELQTADVFIIRIGSCRASVIERCPGLKVIGRTGVGFDSVDVAAATAHQIPVVVTPGANNRSVAEYVMAAMFALSRNMLEADAELRKGNWQIRDAGKSFELEGRKIGIVGVGAIGRLVASLCQGIGMKTAGYDALFPQNVVAAGCELYTDLHEMIRDCDVVTVHSPLTPETVDMFTAKEFAMMKKTAVLINAARGPIVNIRDLAEALNNGVIAGAAVDVYDEEPVPMDSPAFTAKNLICTPHIAAMTNEGSVRMSVMCVEGCLAVCRGEQWPYVVDRNVYGN
nr:hydroxyacid dehydrogenase [Lachnospiraceae bacterium]